MMIIFTSIYGMVDGFFISNFVGKTPFAAINLIYPFLMILGVFGFIFGTGGSALIGKLLGEGKHGKANSVFSFLVYITVFVGIVVALAGFLAMEPVARLLGADAAMLPDCVLYGRLVLLGLPFVMLQFEFHSFYVVAEKPKLGFLVTIAAGVTNMIFDLILVAVLNLGVVGAALATVASQVVGGIIPILYFSRRNTSLLKLGRTQFDGIALLKTCTNGASEFVSGVSMSLVGMLYNMQLMKYAGENGVAAYGVLMYVNFLFLSMFIGYAVGTAPIASYHFGARNQPELKNILGRSVKILAVSAVTMLLAGELLARPIAMIFVGYDAALTDLTVSGFRIFSFNFLFAAVPIYGSSFFTALNDGFVSAAISFLRTVVFETAAVLLLPLLFGIDGVWFSLVAAELVAGAVTLSFLTAKRKKYGY
ncbi:MATE family efflux transporter [bacterium]|nr:MATE family efflux transporter [bacterium]